MANEEKILISPMEAKEILGVSRTRIYNLLKTKDFPCFRLGNNIYVNRELLQTWADNQCKKQV